MHPFPWRGEGPWVGVEAPSYEEGVGVDGTSKPKAWLPKKKSRWNIQTIGLAPKEEGVGVVGTSKFYFE